MKVTYVTMFTFFGGKREEGGQITYGHSNAIFVRGIPGCFPPPCTGPMTFLKLKMVPMHKPSNHISLIEMVYTVSHMHRAHASCYLESTKCCIVILPVLFTM